MPGLYVQGDTKAEALSRGWDGTLEFPITDDELASIDGDVSSVEDIESGNLIVVGDAAMVALTDYDTDTGAFTADFAGAHEIEVVAEDDSGNSAVMIGDWLYYDRASEVVNKDSTAGPVVGQALEKVTAGATSTIGVKLQQIPT